eukprot:TRINITY_DN7_c0_g2_i1.p1 TRINITY_DN7_c0_g2~~TRINITY_DN7_c0_g2_i1.p1  ORF type:complete len:277 (+),score=101.00 TRINITY_DN7_c0_g2_i1:40-870(+)
MATNIQEDIKNNSIEDINQDSDNSKQIQRKRKLKPFHKITTHRNPLNDNRFPEIPFCPGELDLVSRYPYYFGPNYTEPLKPKIELADIGCGFGGLLVGLSPLFPNKLIIGMEIRDKAVEYVQERIQKLREQGINSGSPSQYQNISVTRSNCMKYLPTYFVKGQLCKIFFLFPDPHFKRSNHRRRIISTTLLAEYAYVLADNGIIYTITDVHDLHTWMVTHISVHPLFERVTDEELESDPVIPLVRNCTEEGKKVAKSNGSKFLAVFRRKPRIPYNY